MEKTKEQIQQLLGTEDSEILNGIRIVRKEEENHAERYNPYTILSDNSLFDKLYGDFLKEKSPLADLIKGSK